MIHNVFEHTQICAKNYRNVIKNSRNKEKNWGLSTND